MGAARGVIFANVDMLNVLHRRFALGCVFRRGKRYSTELFIEQPPQT